MKKMLASIRTLTLPSGAKCELQCKLLLGIVPCILRRISCSIAEHFRLLQWHWQSMDTPSNGRSCPTNSRRLCCRPNQLDGSFLPAAHRVWIHCLLDEMKVHNCSKEGCLESLLRLSLMALGPL